MTEGQDPEIASFKVLRTNSKKINAHLKIRLNGFLNGLSNLIIRGD